MLRRDTYGRTALQVVELLLHACSRCQKASDNTCLFWKQRYSSIANLLRISSGIPSQEPNTKLIGIDTSEHPPVTACQHIKPFLHFAARIGDARTVAFILRNHLLDVNILDGHGKTALHLAVEEGHTECVRLLLSHPGINVNIASKKGDTPLKVALESLSNFFTRKEITQLLKERGAKQ